MIKLNKFYILTILTLLVPSLCFASAEHSSNDSWILLAVAIIISGAALSWTVKLVGFPAVLGELSLGMALAVLAHYGVWHWQEALHNKTIAWLAELGSILLLFEIGLESKLKDLISVGKHGSIAAILGVVLPFALGIGAGELLFPHGDFKLNLFLGATLAATSTGISVRVFKDLGILQNPACQIVLTASIIDDILGLIILSIVSGIVIAGAVSLATIGGLLLSVVLFFVVAIVVASRLNPILIRWLLKINNEEAMVMIVLIAFSLIWAWFADAVGLAAIIGSFMAGLMLDVTFFGIDKKPHWFNSIDKLVSPEHAEQYHSLIKKRVNEEQDHYLISLIKPFNYVLVPFFFVYAGMQVDIVEVASWNTLAIGGALSVAAIVGKIFCGTFLPKTINKWIVGVGMIPRGEINQEAFAGVLIMVVVTSIVTPLILQHIVKKNKLNAN